MPKFQDTPSSDSLGPAHDMTIERLWNPFQTCSTTDNQPVDLKFSGGDIHFGYFSSSQGRWVNENGVAFPEGMYPTHWRRLCVKLKLKPEDVK
jgi:hypothetical protein